MSMSPRSELAAATVALLLAAAGNELEVALLLPPQADASSAPQRSRAPSATRGDG
jgi:hypothetical protein